MKKLYEKLALFKASLKQGQPKIQLPKIPEIKPIKPVTIKKLAVKPAKLPAVAPDSKKDPKKIAQQIKDGSMSTKTVKLLKGSDGLPAKPKISEDKTPMMKQPAKGEEEHYGSGYRFVDGHKDSFHGSSPEQINLNHGINIASPSPIGLGAMSAHRAFNIKNNSNVILKNAEKHFDRKERGHDQGFDSAQREVLFHDMAHKFFNMGKYVPTTAGFSKLMTSVDDPNQIRKVNFSAMKEIPNPSKLRMNMDADIVDDNQKSSLKNMYNSGDMHKIAIMDNIMGNHDRHGDNYLFDKDANLHLIDHGTSFDYGNFDPVDTPHFYRSFKYSELEPGLRNRVDAVKNDKIHPEAKKWLLNLNHDDAINAFKQSGYDLNDKHVSDFMTRLSNLQHLASHHPEKDLTSLLKENRLSTGPMHSRYDEEPKAALG
jgi:hypothetical protein